MGLSPAQIKGRIKSLAELNNSLTDDMCIYW